MPKKFKAKPEKKKPPKRNANTPKGDIISDVSKAVQSVTMAPPKPMLPPQGAAPGGTPQPGAPSPMARPAAPKPAAPKPMAAPKPAGMPGPPKQQFPTMKQPAAPKPPVTSQAQQEGTTPAQTINFNFAGGAQPNINK